MAPGLRLDDGGSVAFRQRREGTFLVVEFGVGIIRAFHVGPEEAGKGDRAAAGREPCGLVTGRR